MWYQCYNLHTLGDSVSALSRIFIENASCCCCCCLGKKERLTNYQLLAGPRGNSWTYGRCWWNILEYWPSQKGLWQNSASAHISSNKRMQTRLYWITQIYINANFSHRTKQYQLQLSPNKLQITKVFLNKACHQKVTHILHSNFLHFFYLFFIYPLLYNSGSQTGSQGYQFICLNELDILFNVIFM